MLNIFENLGADIRTLPHPTEPREGSSTSASHWSPRPCSADQTKLTKTKHAWTNHSKIQLDYIHNQQLKTQK